MSRIRDKFKELFTSEFIRHSATLLSANALSQIIALVVYPIVTRIYSPGDFGEFTLFLSISGVVAILSTGRYEAAIVLPENKNIARALFHLCIFIGIVLFLIVTPFSIFFGEDFAGLFKSSSLQEWLPLLPIFVLITGIWQAFNYYLSREKQFKKIGAYNVNQSVINSGLKYVFGILGFLRFGLIFATFFGQLIALVVSIISFRKGIREILSIRKRMIIYAAKKYRNFPQFQLPHALLNMFSGNLPILLLSVYFDMHEIGLFSLALTMCFRPINLFSASVYQVLYQKISENYSARKSIAKLFNSFILKSSLFAIPGFFILFFVSEDLFGFFFGAEWSAAGEYLNLMLPWLFIVISASSLSFIPNIFEKQKHAMFIEFGYISLRIIALFIGVWVNSFYLSIALYCGVSALVLGGQMLWYYSLVKKYESSLKLL